MTPLRALNAFVVASGLIIAAQTITAQSQTAPDITGSWQRQGFTVGVKPTGQATPAAPPAAPPPPLTPAYLKEWQDRLKVIREADAKGQPIVKKLADCTSIKDESKRDACQSLFFDVSNCKTDADATKCTKKAIAEWTVSNLNGDIMDQSKAIILVTEVPLVKDGEPVKDKKSGQQIVKKLTDCDKLEGTYQETCRALFISVSNCVISPPDDGNVDGCKAEKAGEWVDENMSEESP